MRRPPVAASFAAPPQAPPRPRILVAEDNPAIQTVLQAMLSSLDAEVTVVGDGQAALDALAAQAFDLVLMDVQMPVLDGLSAVRRLRRREAEADQARTPVLALTGAAAEDRMGGFREAGMDAVIGKPFSMDGLLGAVGAALGNDVAGLPFARTA